MLKLQNAFHSLGMLDPYHPVITIAPAGKHKKQDRPPRGDDPSTCYALPPKECPGHLRLPMGEYKLPESCL